MKFSSMAATYILIVTHNKFMIRPSSSFLSKLFHTSSLSLSNNKNSTIIEDEVSKHTKLAESWWDPKGPMKALHTMNTVRIPFIKSNLLNVGHINENDLNSPKPLSKLRILDIGCGGGLLSESLARLGGKVTGIDPSKDLINIATNHANTNLKTPPEYISTTIEQYSEDNKNKFDVVVMSEVIEHITNKKLFLELSINTLKPGGSLFITTPNRSFISYLGTIIMGEYVLGLVPKGTHSYEQFIKPKELSQELEQFNCNCRNVSALNYNPLFNTWSISGTPIFNYALHAVKEDNKIN